MWRRSDRLLHATLPARGAAAQDAARFIPPTQGKTSMTRSKQGGTMKIDPATLARLRDGLASSDPRVRAEGVDALAALGDVPGLCRALASPDRYLRLRAVRALAPICGRIVACRLARLWRDAEPSVRWALAEALIQRGGILARLLLQRLVRDGHPAVRHAAVQGLCTLGGSRSSAALHAVAAADPEPSIRAAASAALRRAETQVARRRGGWRAAVRTAFLAGNRPSSS
jgi:HEAT repeat protein